MRAYRKVDERDDLRIDGSRLTLLGAGAALILLLVFLLGVVVGKALWGGSAPPTEARMEEQRVDPEPVTESAKEPSPSEYTFYEDLKRTDPERTGGPAAMSPAAPASPAPAAVGSADNRPEVPSSTMAEQAGADPVVTGPGSASSGEESTEVKAPLPAPLFTIQVGSFLDRNAAEDLSRQISAHGISAQVVATSVGGRTWYRVQVGRFDTRADADGFHQGRLKPKGVQGFVTTR